MRSIPSIYFTTPPVYFCAHVHIKYNKNINEECRFEVSYFRLICLMKNYFDFFDILQKKISSFIFNFIFTIWNSYIILLKLLNIETILSILVIVFI